MKTKISIILNIIFLIIIIVLSVMLYKEKNGTSNNKVVGIYQYKDTKKTETLTLNDDYSCKWNYSECKWKIENDNVTITTTYYSTPYEEGETRFITSERKQLCDEQIQEILKTEEECIPKTTETTGTITDEGILIGSYNYIKIK